MKFEYLESDYGFDITMVPETPAEVAQLFRATRNVKAEKPTMHLSFTGKEPTLYLSMQKKKANLQINSINSETR